MTSFLDVGVRCRTEERFPALPAEKFEPPIYPRYPRWELPATHFTGGTGVESAVASTRKLRPVSNGAHRRLTPEDSGSATDTENGRHRVAANPTADGTYAFEKGPG